MKVRISKISEDLYEEVIKYIIPYSEWVNNIGKDFIPDEIDCFFASTLLNNINQLLEGDDWMVLFDGNSHYKLKIIQ